MNVQIIYLNSYIMAFTRFHDDPARIKKKLQESTYVGLYHLNTPGNGQNIPYMDDINIRMQKWGANLQTNSFDINQELRGYRPITKYDVHTYNQPNTTSLTFPTQSFGVDETRASLPAWTFRDKNTFRPPYLHKNPQENLFYNFENNIQSRMLEKDYYNSPYY